MPTTALTNFLSWWVGHCRRYAWAIVIGALVLGALSLKYTAGNIGIDTDTADMIARDLPWRQTYIRYKKDFPQFVDTLLLVVDGDSPDRAEEAATQIAQSLRQQDDLFHWVNQPGDSPFFRRNALLFLSEDELEQLAQNLSRMQPFLGALASEPTLPGLSSLLEKALKADASQSGVELTPVLEALSEAVEAERLT